MMHLHCHDWQVCPLGDTGILFSVLVSPKFELKGRDVRVRIMEYSDEYRKHTVVYVYRRKDGRVLWGISLIQEGTSDTSDLYRLTLCAEFYLHFLLTEVKQDIDAEVMLSILQQCQQKSKRSGAERRQAIKELRKFVEAVLVESRR